MLKRILDWFKPKAKEIDHPLRWNVLSHNRIRTHIKILVDGREISGIDSIDYDYKKKFGIIKFQYCIAYSLKVNMLFTVKQLMKDHVIITEYLLPEFVMTNYNEARFECKEATKTIYSIEEYLKK